MMKLAGKMLFAFLLVCICSLEYGCTVKDMAGFGLAALEGYNEANAYNSASSSSYNSASTDDCEMKSYRINVGNEILFCNQDSFCNVTCY